MIRRVLLVLLAIGVAATTAALGARLSWFLELFTHFRVQYTLLLTLTGLALLATGSRHAALLAAVALLPNLLSIAPYLPGTLRPTAIPAETGIFRLVAYNLLYTQDNGVRTLGYLAGSDADVLVLSEYTPRWRRALTPLEGDFPYLVLRPRKNQWGIAVYSRLPIVETEDLDLGDDESSHLRVRVRRQSGTLDVYAIHLASPPSRRQAAQRIRQLDALGALLRDADPAVPLVVAGDFNLTPFSPYFGDLLQPTGLRDARRPFGLHATWPAWPLPLWIPIDHCLVGARTRAVRVATGPTTGSDHWPLECDLVP